MVEDMLLNHTAITLLSVLALVLAVVMLGVFGRILYLDVTNYRASNRHPRRVRAAKAAQAKQATATRLIPHR